MKVTDAEGSPAEVATFFEWQIPERLPGDLLVVGEEARDGRYRKAFPLDQPDALVIAAAFASELHLRVALPVYSKPPYEDVDIRRCHVSAIRFAAGVEPATILELTAPPQILVWLGDDAPSWALWGLWESMEGGDLLGMQVRESGLSGGDPEWSGSPSELVPIPGVSYVVNGVERTAIEWPMP